MFNSLEDMIQDISMESQMVGPEPAPTTEATHKGAPELSKADREAAIKIFSAEYIAKFPVKLCHSNSDGKHDRIVATIDKTNFKKSEIMSYMRDLVAKLNKKQSRFVFFFSEKGYVLYANEPESPKEDKKKTEEPKNPAVENFMVMDPTESYTLEELSKIPMVEAFQSKGLDLKKSVLLMEARLEANPFLPMIIANPTRFASEEAYTDFLVESFLDGMKYMNYSPERAAESIASMYFNPYEVSKASIRATSEAVTRNRGEIDRKVHSLDKTIQEAKEKASPFVRKFFEMYQNTMGEEAAKEEVVHGGVQGWLISWRRLFMRLIIVWKSHGLVSKVMNTAAGAILPSIAGFPWNLIIWGVLLVARMWFYIDTVKALAGFGDKEKEAAKGACLHELELELKITREKIEDARAAGDTKAKYELMRVENKIEKEIYRIRYGRTPSQFKGE